MWKYAVANTHTYHHVYWYLFRFFFQSVLLRRVGWYKPSYLHLSALEWMQTQRWDSLVYIHAYILIKCRMKFASLFIYKSTLLFNFCKIFVRVTHTHKHRKLLPFLPQVIHRRVTLFIQCWIVNKITAETTILYVGVDFHIIIVVVVIIFVFSWFKCFCYISRASCRRFCCSCCYLC